MKFIRKFLNIQNKEQHIFVNDEIIQIYQLFFDENSKINKSNRAIINKKQLENKKCPKCNGEAIDKISYDKIINSCSNCRNEWFKYDEKKDIDLNKSNFWNIGRELTREIRIKFPNSYNNAVNIFKPFCAESLYVVFKTYDVNLKDLRKSFNSVFDKKFLSKNDLRKEKIKIIS